MNNPSNRSLELKISFFIAHTGVLQLKNGSIYFRCSLKKSGVVFPLNLI